MKEPIDFKGIKVVLSRHLALPQTKQQILAEIEEVRARAYVLARGVEQEISKVHVPLMDSNAPTHCDDLSMELALDGRLCRLAERMGLQVPTWPEFPELDKLADFALACW